MSITVVWDNPEHTILRYIYDGPWSMDTFYPALQESHNLMDTVNCRVGIIIDVQKSKLVPNGVLSHGTKVTASKHPNQGKSIVVGASGLVRSLFDVYKKVYRSSFDETSFGFARTLDEARALLLERPVVTP